MPLSNQAANRLRQDTALPTEAVSFSNESTGYRQKHVNAILVPPARLAQEAEMDGEAFTRALHDALEQNGVRGYFGYLDQILGAGVAVQLEGDMPTTISSIRLNPDVLFRLGLAGRSDAPGSWKPSASGWGITNQ